MSKRYPIPSPGMHRVEESIKRSRFITSMMHAPDADAARQFIASIKEEFPDATHNCWAFAAGPPGDTASVGMSDDGEPHGTAGRPMLNVLHHGGVGEIAVVVTRYFGGVKLGTGGLVRAYSGMVNLGLESLPTEEKVERVHLTVLFDYSFVTQFKLLLPDFEAEVVQEDFGADAEFSVRMPVSRQKSFEHALSELTAGGALVEVLKETNES